MVSTPLPYKMGPERARAPLQAVQFVVSASFSFIWTWGSLIQGLSSHGLGIIRFFASLVAIVVNLSLQTFLLYRFFDALCIFPDFTGCFDAFFYETQQGTWALIALALSWALSVSMSELSALVTVFYHTPMTEVFGNFVALGDWAKAVALLFIYMSPFVFAGLFVWVVMTVMHARRRLQTLVQRYEEVPMGPHNHQDDWDED